MAKQTINIGSSANKGDGDPIRTAFTKVNENFTELYDKVTVLENGQIAKVQDTQGSVFGDDSTLLVDAVNSIIPASVITGTLTNNLIGDVTGNITGDTAGTHTGAVVGNITGDVIGSVFADDSTLLVDGVAGKIVGDVENNSVITGRVKSQDDIDLYVFAGGTGAVILAGQSDLSIGHTSGQTDIYGDVEFNNGTTAFQSGNDVEFNCPVDFTNATITMPQYISLADLKTEVAASVDFAAFKTRIAAL